MIRRPPRSTHCISSAASDVYKRQDIYCSGIQILNPMKLNKITKPCEDFSMLWNQLIKTKKLYVSNCSPIKWFTVDKINDLKRLRRLKN